MHPDISRDSFDSKQNYTRVVLQQGRLLIDADFNEQTEIIVGQFRALVNDLIGWHGGPNVTKNGTAPDRGCFAITLDPSKKPIIEGGHYYVDGVVVNFGDANARSGFEFDTLPTLSSSPKLHGDSSLIVVDLCEEDRSYILESTLLDPAFGGQSATIRRKLRVRFARYDFDADAGGAAGAATALNATKTKIANEESFFAAADGIVPLRAALPKLRPDFDTSSNTEADCESEGSAGSSGLENQLYRVEIHSAPDAGDAFWDGAVEDGKPAGNAAHAVTLKWSRENGSVAVGAEITVGETIQAVLSHWWRDDRTAFRVGEWVEVLSGDDERGALAQITDIQVESRTLILNNPESAEDQPSIATIAPKGRCYLRRWDHPGPAAQHLFAGAVLVAGHSAVSDRIPLEDGLGVILSLPTGAAFQPGDYWLIPARAETNSVIWPTQQTGNEMGFTDVNALHSEHHYAPIAIITPDGANKKIIDLRRNIEPLAK